jgi:hypothetical protein
MTPQPRSDKGRVRKVSPEELLEAIHAAKLHFHHQRTNKRAIYRFCVETRSRKRGHQTTPHLQHEIRQPTLAGRHPVQIVL